MAAKKKDMHSFFEFFIERLVWIWMPLYALQRVIRDMLEEWESQRNSK